MSEALVGFSLEDLGLTAPYKRGVVAGSFDLLHPGHLMMLQHCARMCKELTVALHVDPSVERTFKSRPVETVFERQVRLSAVRGVQGIVAYETENDLDNMLFSGHFDVRFVGGDHAADSDFITGAASYKYKSAGVDTVIVPRLHRWSSSELRKRIDL